MPLTQIQLDLIQQRHGSRSRIVWTDGFQSTCVNWQDWQQYQDDHQALLDEGERLAKQLEDCHRLLKDFHADAHDSLVQEDCDEMLRRHGLLPEDETP